MAEALVLLGAIASSSQLAEQFIKTCRRIYKAYRLIDDDSLSLRKQLVQLKQLQGIARLIIQNPGLQTDSIASVLGTCLSEVEELNRLLDECTATRKNRPREKIRKAFNAVANAKKIEAIFQRLQRQEMSLALCIHEVNSRVLFSIDGRSRSLHTDVAQILQVIRSEHSYTPAVLHTKDQAVPSVEIQSPVSHSVAHCYPSPVGTLIYYNFGRRQLSHDTKCWTERGFRFLPTKLWRLLGATILEFRITVHPNFDKYHFDFRSPIHRKYDDEIIKALGFDPESPRYEWEFPTPDFTLLRKALQERRLSPNDRFRSEQDRSLLELLVMLSNGARIMPPSARRAEFCKKQFEICDMLLEYGPTQETIHNSLNAALSFRSFNNQSGRFSLSYSIPSLLLRRGARSCATGLLLSGTSSGRSRPYGRYSSYQSYLSYLLPLEAHLAYIQTDFLSHLDLDGISELVIMDRLLFSTLYHTWPSFKNAVIKHLDISGNQLPPVGLMALPDILTRLQDLTVDARRFFFETICAYGPKDVLEPFVQSKTDLRIPPLTLPEAFLNENTFKSLAHTSVRVNNLYVLTKVLSNQFMLERSHDGYSVQNLLRTCSPNTGSREWALVHFPEKLSDLDHGTEFGDDHKRICSILVEQGYCSPRTPNGILEMELVWVALRAIRKRAATSPASLQKSEMKRTALLSHLIDHYQPSIEPEISEFPGNQTSEWVNLSELMQYTPLMLAVTAGDYPVVKLLVSGGANITKAHSPKKLSAWDLAMRNLNFDHPRTSVHIPPSGVLGRYSVSEEEDVAIYEFFLQNTNQSGPVTLEEQTELGPRLLDRILQVFAHHGKIFALACKNIWLEWRYAETKQDFLKKILPLWLSPYLIYFHVNVEDAGFILFSFGACVLFNLYHILKTRPRLRHFCFLFLIAYIGKWVL